MARTNRELTRQISLIAKAVNVAKAKTIRRINRQLEKMSPNDLRALERLIGRR